MKKLCPSSSCDKEWQNLQISFCNFKGKKLIAYLLKLIMSALIRFYYISSYATEYLINIYVEIGNQSSFLIKKYQLN